MKTHHLLHILLCLNIANIINAEKQKFIGPCKLSADNRDECIRAKVDNLIALVPRMRDKYDELIVNNLEINDITSNIGYGSIAVKYFKILNCIGFSIANLKSQYDKDKRILLLEFDVRIDMIKTNNGIELDFYFTGEMERFKSLKTKGVSEAILEKVSANILLEMEVVEESTRGEKYMFLKPINVDAKINCASLKLLEFKYISVPRNRFHNALVNTLMKEYLYTFCVAFTENKSVFDSSRDKIMEKLQEKFDDFEVIE